MPVYEYQRILVLHEISCHIFLYASNEPNGFRKYTAVIASASILYMIVRSK